MLRLHVGLGVHSPLVQSGNGCRLGGTEVSHFRGAGAEAAGDRADDVRESIVGWWWWEVYQGGGVLWDTHIGSFTGSCMCGVDTFASASGEQKIEGGQEKIC